jgi:Polyketide cyclase / dehydrase and lipid transport
MQWTRMRVFVSEETNCDADAFFAELMDFSAVMRWMPKDNPPLRLTKVELAPGHEVGVRPCIRYAFQDKSSLPEEARAFAPDIVEEELLCGDRDTRTFSYNLIGEPYGLRNYVALIEVDPLGPQRCRVSCSSRWDSADGRAASQLVSGIEDMFRRGIIQGITRLVQESADSPHGS